MAPNNNKIQPHGKQQMSAATGQQVSSAPATDKFKCYRCKKVKPLMGYSNKQQEAAKASVRARKVPIVACRECSDQTVVEIKCIDCKKVKGTSGFSKVQAKFPETARCLKCVEERTSLNPSKNDSDDDIDDSDATDSDEEDRFISVTSTDGFTYDT